MSLRRKTPTDMAGVKKSRSCSMRKVTAAAAKIKAVKHDDPEEIRQIAPKEMERILASLDKTEAGFEKSFKEALDFAPTGEEEDTFYEEEEAAKDLFDEAINEVKDQAKFLIDLRKAWASVAYLSRDVKALETNLDNGENCTTFHPHLEKTIERLREQCDELTLSDHHSVKEELENCSLRLGTLRLQAAAAISPRLPIKSSAPEAPELVATQPYNLSQCSTTMIKSSQLEATTIKSSQLEATTIKSSQLEATTIKSSQLEATTTKSSQLEATTIKSSQLEATTIKSSQLEATTTKSSQLEATTTKSSQLEATLQSAKSTAVQLVATQPYNLSQCSTTFKSSAPEATLQSETKSAAALSFKSSPPEAAQPPSLTSSFATIQETRASCTAVLNKALDSLKASPINTAIAVSRLNTEDIKEILKTTQLTKSIFIQAMENAQLFTPKEDEDNFHLKESIINDSFNELMFQIMDLGKQLLFMKTIGHELNDLWIDLQDVRHTLYQCSRDNQMSNIRQLTTIRSSLRKKWQPAKTLSSDPFKVEFEVSTIILNDLRDMMTYELYGQGTQTLKSTLSTQSTSATEKKTPDKRQDNTSLHKPQKSQVDSVSAPTSAPVPPPTITDTTDCHPEVVAAPNTEQSPCQQRSHASSTTPLQPTLAPPPRMPSSPPSLQSILGPPPRIPSSPTSPQSRLDPPPRIPSSNSSYPRDCLLCPKEKHPLHLCPAWATLTIPQRLNHIILKKLCSNCLARGHSRLTCRSKHHCKICGLSHHTTTHITPASEPEAQGIPPPQRLLVGQPHLSSPTTTPHNLKTDSRSTNLAEEFDFPLHPTKIQNQHDCSDPTALLTSLLPSKDAGTQHQHPEEETPEEETPEEETPEEETPEEETTSSLKDCEQLQSTYCLCSSTNDEDTLTTSISLLQSTDIICPSNNSASQTESRQPPQQELLVLHPPRSLTDGSTAPADLLSTGTQQQLLPPSRNNILENLTAPLQPPHHSMILTDGYTATTGLITPPTSAHHILRKDILPQAPSAECQTPQQIQSLQATSAECQTPQQIHLPQATVAFQQAFRTTHSREDALSLLYSDCSKQHHAPSLLTEKMDTVYLTRLLLCEHPQPTYKSLLINKLMSTNSVSFNPATLHYWIDSSIYLSWLHDKKQQVSVVTNHSIYLLQAPRSITWSPRPTPALHTQPSEHGLLEEQSIIVFPSLLTVAENYHKQPPNILDNLTPEVSIYKPSGSHSPTHPVRPAARNIGTLIVKRLWISLLMYLHLIPQLLQSPYYIITMNEQHPAKHCKRLQFLPPVQPTTRSIGTLIIGRLCVFLLMCLHILQQLYPYYSSIKLDEHRPPNHCKRLQSLLAIHLWLPSLLQAVLLFTFSHHSRQLHRHQLISDATNYLHSNSDAAYDTDPNLLLLSARRLSRSIYFYQRWGILPHLHHLANGAFFSYLTDVTATNTALYGFSIWNNLRQYSKTLAVEKHFPLLSSATHQDHHTYLQATSQQTGHPTNKKNINGTPWCPSPGSMFRHQRLKTELLCSQTSIRVPELTRQLPEAECQKLLPPKQAKTLTLIHTALS